MDLFQQSVASVLEVAEVDSSTRFREVPGWCSLQAFGLLVLMENDWQSPISPDRLSTINTIGELELEAFLAFAASLLKVPRQSLSGATAYASLPEWDSVNHLRLAMESEKRFGFSYSIEQIPELRCLSDFVSVGSAR